MTGVREGEEKLERGNSGTEESRRGTERKLRCGVSSQAGEDVTTGLARKWAGRAAAVPAADLILLLSLFTASRTHWLNSPKQLLSKEQHSAVGKASGPAANCVVGSCNSNAPATIASFQFALLDQWRRFFDQR